MSFAESVARRIRVLETCRDLEWIAQNNSLQGQWRTVRGLLELGVLVKEWSGYLTQFRLTNDGVEELARLVASEGCRE